MRAEHADTRLSVYGGTIGLHSFKAFEAIVENTGCRIKGEVLIRSYPGGGPARFSGPFDGKHVVYILYCKFS